MRQEIEKALLTSYISKEALSSPKYHSELLFNDHKRGVKILQDIQEEMVSSKRMYFSVAFVTESGIAVLANEFLYALENNIEINLLTSDYLYFNEPKVFKRLLTFPNINVKIIEGKALHNKAYIFEHENHTKTIIGSANLTAKALTENQEWSVKFSSLDNGKITQSIKQEFNLLWEQATPLTENWIIDYSKNITTKYWIEKPQKEDTILPNKMQTQALKNLDLLRKEGKEKALLISSTGTGKTYLSAFDVKNYNPKRMLFVIHREQIAKEAMASFQRILPNKNYGLLSGNNRNYESDYIFTTIQTLSRDQHLYKFSKSHFDYIIIDEAHHSEATSYQKVIDYFTPKFLLGMTATPERTDGKDIYQHFDHNIAYEIRLQTALEEEMLCPFHYYGVTDITINNQIIDDESDFNDLTHNDRINHILKYTQYYGYSGDRLKGLMFVSRNDEAIQLSQSLNKKGLKTIALSGATSYQEREDAIKRLTSPTGDLDYIITVDIFNEGIDIPEVNQIVMLRPTQSAIIFVQQLGRGLRKNQEKDYLVVIDFIGNYQNNFLIPIALSGDTSYNKENLKKFLIEGNNTLPGSSTIHFDEITKEKIYSAITQTNFAQIKFLKEQYQDLKTKLGRIPKLTDYLDYNSLDPQTIFKHNKFNNYYDFLKYMEKDIKLNLTKHQQNFLSWISLEFSNGKRLDELIILNKLIQNQPTKLSNHTYGKTHYNNLKSILNLSFYVQSDYKKYGQKPFITIENDKLKFDPSLNLIEFKDMVEDVIDYGIKRHHKYYSQNIIHHNLSHYEQYSKKDVCRLLNWEKDEKGTMYGYRFKHNTFPIFVTYHKSDDISQSIQYDDKFLDQKTFSWMSRNKRTLESTEIKELIRAKNEKIPVDLFMKKDDEEDNQFFYIGAMHPIKLKQTTIKDNEGNDLPIVNVIFEFKENIRKDIYDYFTKN